MTSNLLRFHLNTFCSTSTDSRTSTTTSTLSSTTTATSTTTSTTTATSTDSETSTQSSTTTATSTDSRTSTTTSTLSSTTTATSTTTSTTTATSTDSETSTTTTTTSTTTTGFSRITSTTTTTSIAPIATAISGTISVQYSGSTYYYPDYNSNTWSTSNASAALFTFYAPDGNCSEVTGAFHIVSSFGSSTVQYLGAESSNRDGSTYAQILGVTNEYNSIALGRSPEDSTLYYDTTIWDLTCTSDVLTATFSADKVLCVTTTNGVPNDMYIDQNCNSGQAVTVYFNQMNDRAF